MMFKDKEVSNAVSPLNEAILMMDGIGDFFVLETLMPREVNFKTVFWASRVQHFIVELWNLLPNYSLNHRFLWTDWDSVYCFLRRRDVVTFLRNKNIDIGISWKKVTDYGRYHIYYLIQNRQKLVRYESSFLKFELCKIDKFNLPINYYCICPYSSYNKKFNQHDHAFNRDFKDDDWESVVRFLEIKKTKGVILNIGDDECPHHELLLNLSNQTTLAESIEILKKSEGYLGIDSCLSVLAAMIFPVDKLFVRSNNSHCYEWKHVYYYPQTNFNFIKSSLAGIESSLKNDKIYI